MQLLRNADIPGLGESNARYIVDEKWLRVERLVKLRATLHLIFLVVLSVYVTTGLGSVFWAFVFFLLALCNMAFEGFQVYAEGSRQYLRDMWNYVDFLGTPLFLVHCLLSYLGVVQSSGDPVIGGTVLLLWSSGIRDLKAFESTRYLVRLMREIVKDMRGFFAILGLCVYAFAVSFCALTEEQCNVLDALGSMYRFSLGDIGSATSPRAVDLPFVALATVVLPLVLMNMLVALMMDTFDRVQTNAQAAEYRDRIELILEVEHL